MRRAILLVISLTACTAGQQAGFNSSGASLYKAAEPREESFIWESAAWLELEGGRCSAVLIAPQVVLTAAHCIDTGKGDELPLKVHFFGPGSVEIASNEVVSAAVPFEYSEKDFSLSGINSDLALVLFRDPAPVTSKPAALHKSNEFIAVGLTVLAVGSGRSLPTENEELKLHYAPMKIEGFNGTKRTYSMQLSSPNSEACAGDSGGPVFSLLTDRPTVLGVASLGDKNCTSAGVSVYTYVPNFAAWIELSLGYLGQPEARRNVIRPRSR